MGIDPVMGRAENEALNEKRQLKRAGVG